MSKAKNGDTIKVHYTGKLGDGTVFDSSEGRDPLQFTLGENQVIPGFEEAIVGMETGETKSFDIPADQAYGERCDGMVMKIDRSQFPEDMNPEIGQQLRLGQQSGETLIVKVIDVSETSVTIDGNHPLAGEDLTFEVELSEIV